MKRMRGRKKKAERKKVKIQTAQTIPASKAAPLPEQGSGNHTREILYEMAIGLFFTVLLLGVKLIAERTRFFKEQQVAAYNWLLSTLPSGNALKEVPIVIDISGLQPKPLENRSVLFYTDRVVLRSLIDAIAAQGPTAIGVDIDFAPDEKGLITMDDQAFFRECLSIKEQRNIPVFLGVERTKTNPPAHWLGNDAFKALAAGVSIATDNIGRVVKWIQPENDPRTSAEGFPNPKSSRLQSMSAMLTGATEESLVDSSRWLNWAFTHVTERQLPGVRIGEYAVNYSQLDAIKNVAINTWKSEEIPRYHERLQGRVVLIGKGAWLESTDKFVVPGQTEAISGVYLHACGVWTLARSRLYELTHRGRIVLDLILSAAIICSIAAVRLQVYARTGQITRPQTLQQVFTVLVALLSFTVGVLLFWVTRVIWDDFVVALFVLAAHPVIEGKSRRLLGSINKKARAALERMARADVKEVTK